MNKDIFIKILEYGLKKTDGFNYEELISELSPNDWEKGIIQRQFEIAFRNEAVGKDKECLFWCIKASGQSNGTDHRAKYVMSLYARFKYIDYLELKAATQTAKEAKESSELANLLAFIAVIAALVIPMITGWESILKLINLVLSLK